MTKTCIGCFTTFEARAHNHLFCSVPCRSEHRNYLAVWRANKAAKGQPHYYRDHQRKTRMLRRLWAALDAQEPLGYPTLWI